jgi:RsiW-degrading membrane proteinase PrsW (M82 family)
MNPSVVTAFMLAVYTAVLSLFLIRVQTNKKMIIIIVGLGLFLGFISSILIGILSIIELQFNDLGFIRVLFIAPVQEEIAKFLSFLIGYVLTVRSARRWSKRFHEPPPIIRAKDFILLGAFIGLFFAATENLFYYVSQNMFFTLMRTLLTWPMHMIATSISAYGFSKYKRNNRFVFFLILAISIHILYNFAINVNHF